MQVTNNFIAFKMTSAKLKNRLRDIVARQIIVPEVTGHYKQRYVKTGTSTLFISGNDLQIRHKQLDKPTEEITTEYLPNQFVTEWVKLVFEHVVR